MKTARQMQQIIEKLAEKHGCDLSYREAHLRLDMPGYDRLSIERIGPNQISVAHYFEQNGDLIADPEVVFFTGATEWIPIAIGQVLGGWREVAWLKPDGSAVDRYLPLAQKEVANFANGWGRAIAKQGWLDRATVTKIATRPESVATA